MPKLTADVTTEQLAGWAAAMAHHDLTNPDAKVLTVEAYFQKVVDGAGNSYRAQHVVESADMLKTKNAALADEAARAKAAEEQAVRIKEEKEALLSNKEAEIVQLQKDLAAKDAVIAEAVAAVKTEKVVA